MRQEKPNEIPVHKLNPELATEIIEFEKEKTNLDKEENKLNHKRALVKAKKDVLWDKIDEVFKDGVSVIAPDGHLGWEIEGKEVYIVKCKKCKELPDNLPDFLNALLGLNLSKKEKNANN
jgi:hypothetical protein